MRFILNWIIYTLAIVITVYILPGVSITGGVVTAIILAIVLGAINTFVRPILLILTLPITVFTLGLFALVINALLVMLAAYLVPGFIVLNFWWALLFAVVLSIINAFLGRLSSDNYKS